MLSPNVIKAPHYKFYSKAKCLVKTMAYDDMRGRDNKAMSNWLDIWARGGREGGGGERWHVGKNVGREEDKLGTYFSKKPSSLQQDISYAS